MNSLETIFSTPDLYPEGIDLPNHKLRFCSMNRECFQKTSFLDHRIIKASNAAQIHDIEALISEAGNIEHGVTHYIFHNAFCCSTLFSRCLNANQDVFVLREPNILMEQASIYRYLGTQILPDLNKSFMASSLDMILKLLSRRYNNNDTVIVKPSDACNNIMDKLLDTNSANKCLLIYSELERFLTAVIKLPQRFEWIKIRANELCLDEMKLTGKLRINPQHLNNIQLTALVWVLHMEKFRRLLKRTDANRVQVLNSEKFMANPVDSVIKYYQFLNVSVDKNHLENNIKKTLSTHSKADHVSFSYEQREEQYQILRETYTHDVEFGINWAISVFGKEIVTTAL